jgi:hypothetical protein
MRNIIPKPRRNNSNPVPLHLIRRGFTGSIATIPFASHERTFRLEPGWTSEDCGKTLTEYRLGSSGERKESEAGTQ